MAPLRTIADKALAERARDLRAAILGASHDRSVECTVAYVEAVRVAWEAMSPEQRAVSTLPAEASSLLSWAQQAVLIQRAITADNLSAVQKAVQYRSMSPEPRIQVNG